MIFKATIKKVKSNKRPNGNLSDVELCAKKRERKKTSTNLVTSSLTLFLYFSLLFSFHFLLKKARFVECYIGLFFKIKTNL